MSKNGIIMIVLVVISAGAYYWFYMRKKDDTVKVVENKVKFIDNGKVVYSKADNGYIGQDLANNIFTPNKYNFKFKANDILGRTIAENDGSYYVRVNATTNILVPKDSIK